MERSSDFSIERIREHYEVFAPDGTFLCSADTRSEAEEELGEFVQIL
ncbi:MAG: hypothetical protein ACOX6J_02330 [Oscillospiraceae bacterium]|jgi:hypothetical protein